MSSKRLSLLIDPVFPLMALPDECIDHVLSFLSPRELSAAAASGIRRLRVLADSDNRWKEFVPSEHKEVLLRSTENLYFASLKRYYYRLATRPLVLDQGAVILYGDRNSGKNSYMIGAHSLGIDFTRSWFWHAMADSRFSDVAMLLEEGTLDFNCTLAGRLLSNKSDYVAYLVFKIALGGYGFESVPVTVGFVYAIDNSNTEDSESEDDDEFVPVASGFVYADENTDTENNESEFDGITRIYFAVGEDIEEGVKVPRHRDGTWLEVQVAEFYINHNGKCDVIITLSGVDCPPMHGLILEGIEVRPKL